MHDGVYIGKTFSGQKTKILILGESHHGDKNEIGKPRLNRLTYEVVNDYLEVKRHKKGWDRSWRFFTKIAQTFDASLIDI